MIEGLSHTEYLSELTTRECEVRREGRVKRLIHQGRSMLFTMCSLLVQQRLIAKRDLRLLRMIKTTGATIQMQGTSPGSRKSV